jgi:hypothetical protein
MRLNSIVHRARIDASSSSKHNFCPIRIAHDLYSWPIETRHPLLYRVARVIAVEMKQTA